MTHNRTLTSVLYDIEFFFLYVCLFVVFLFVLFCLVLFFYWYGTFNDKFTFF